jgi:hypothetical protein
MHSTCVVANLVAVTPLLLDKRDNHAVVLARFAQNCLDKFREIVNMLEDDLPGAAGLDLRTGLHSGPVTAGVLRGDRARFQLFGDTGMIFSLAIEMSTCAMSLLTHMHAWRCQSQHHCQDRVNG